MPNVNPCVSIFTDKKRPLAEGTGKEKDMFAALNLKSLVNSYELLPLITPVVKSDLFVRPHRTRLMLYSGPENLS